MKTNIYTRLYKVVDAYIVFTWGTPLYAPIAHRLALYLSQRGIDA